MKKRIIVKLIILLFLSASVSVSAQEKNRILGNGFSIDCIIGFVPNSYAWVKGDASINREMGLLIGGEIGNRWYLHLNNKLAFGTMVNWLEVSVTKKKSPGDYDWIGDITTVLDIALFETGPIITYALNGKTGIDVFYNIRPTLLNDVAINVTQSVGVGIRRNVLMLNFEYVFGKDPSGQYIDSKPVDNNINHARLSLGFKF